MLRYIPPFAYPIILAALLWAGVHFTGNETRTFDTWLFWGALAACLLVGLIGAAVQRRKP